MKRVKMIAKIVAGLMVLQVAAGNISIGDKAFAKSTSTKTNLKAVTAPVNQDYKKYQERVAAGQNVTSIGGKGLGYIPSPHKLMTGNPKSTSTKSDVTLPSSYDLRTVNNGGYLTSVKDQGGIGSCWSFAACGAMESNILENNGGTYDFSENNMITHHGGDWTADEGGNRYLSAAYYSRWENKDGITGYNGVKCNGGPLLEQQDPYSYTNPTRPANIQSRDTSTLKSARHLTDAYFLQGKDITNPTDTSELTEFKQALMKYGAIDTSIQATDDMSYDVTGDYYDATDHSLYFHTTDPNNMYSNHEVLIVGWDDNFSKDKFATPAPGNGAFIIKNSWGSDIEDGGYFYLSYYDTMAGNEGTIYLTKNIDDGSNIYSYDDLGLVDQIGLPENETAKTVWYSNEFTPRSIGEQLTSTGFYTTEENEAYSVYVVPEVNGNLNVDLSGATPVASGSFQYMGYHSVNFANPINLSSTGEKFAVVVKATVTNPTASGYPIPVEDYSPGYSSRASLSVKAGRGFVSSDGKSWTDVTSTDSTATLCLKAYTNPAVVSSLASGTYYGAQVVHLFPNNTISENIFYTLDGSTPSDDVKNTTSVKYNEDPITIDGNGPKTVVTLKYVEVNRSILPTDPNYANRFSPVYTEKFTIVKPLAEAGKYGRIQGQSRFDTAVSVSQKAFKSADYVVLACGENQHYSDALAATPLASAYNAPILLTPSDSLPTAVQQEIVRLNAKNVIIVGGTGAVSQNIQDDLSNQGLTCTRISGPDRYATSVNVAAKLLTTFGTNQNLIIATGNGYADAISIASYAGATSTPIILTSKDSLGDYGTALLTSLKNYIKNCYIVGGTGVVGTSVEADAQDLLGKDCQVTRLAGANRYDTNQVILNTLEKSYSVDTVYFATGEGFADALSGAVLAAQTASPIVLLSPNSANNASAAKYVASNADSINAKYVLGGTGAVSDSIMSQVLTGK